MRKLLLAGIMLLWVGVAFAQEKTVSGKVTSSKDGSSLSGVNVEIKGTTKSVLTDASGIYKISALGNAQLCFRFKKFKVQTVDIGNRTIIDVQIKPRRRFAK